MNIITVPYNSAFHYLRPDTTLNRECEDLYLNDDIKEIAFTQFLYVRIERAGKAISSKFAHRYYSKYGYGINVTATSLIDDSCPCSYQMANSIDNTTYLSPLYPIEEPSMAQTFDKEIEKITRLTSVRTGDIIALEISAPTLVALPTDQPITFREISFSIK